MPARKSYSKRVGKHRSAPRIATNKMFTHFVPAPALPHGSPTQNSVPATKGREFVAQLGEGELTLDTPDDPNIYNDVRNDMSGVDKDLQRRLGVNSFIVEYGENGGYPVIWGAKSFNGPEQDDDVFLIRGPRLAEAKQGTL